MTSEEIVAHRALAQIASALRVGEMPAMLTLAWAFLSDDDRATLVKAGLTEGWTVPPSDEVAT